MATETRDISIGMPSTFWAWLDSVDSRKEYPDLDKTVSAIVERYILNHMEVV